LFDARDKLAAFANRLGGKGSESSESYRNCWISFNDIPNMHSIQASFKKLKNYISSYNSKTSSNFYSMLGQSAWMKSLSRLLALSSKMFQGLQKGNSVFVHCSDGWDRTSQVILIRFVH
jgi:protein tyrosine phosphatase